MTREMHVTYHFSVSLRKGQAVCWQLCGCGSFVDGPQWSTCISVPHPGLTLEFPGAGSHPKVWPGTGVSQSPRLKAWVGLVGGDILHSLDGTSGCPTGISEPPCPEYFS